MINQLIADSKWSRAYRSDLSVQLIVVSASSGHSCNAINDVHPSEREDEGKLASEGHDNFGLERSPCLMLYLKHAFYSHVSLVTRTQGGHSCENQISAKIHNMFLW